MRLKQEYCDFVRTFLPFGSIFVFFKVRPDIEAKILKYTELRMRLLNRSITVLNQD